jgi:uncharacterized RDD family membrane protein YckC
MARLKCESCGHEFREWVEFCPGCSEPMPGYARPAGFWIRLGAYIIDTLVFIPIIILGFWNTLSLKSTGVLVAGSIPGFLYKPCMEAFFGATLGKMACGIKVINAQGNKLGLFYAYARAFPFLLSSAVALAGGLVLYSSPTFQSATSFAELGQTRSPTYWDAVNPLVTVLILIDCIFAGFMFRKRSLHDLLADSYVVYKEPQATVAANAEPDQVE